MKLGKTKDRRTKFQLHMWVKKEEFSSKNQPKMASSYEKRKIAGLNSIRGSAKMSFSSKNQPKMASSYEKRKNAGLNSIRGSENLQQGGKFWADRTGSIIFKMAAKG